MEKTKLRKTYNILIRLAIILLTLYFIYDQLFYRKDLQSIIDFFPEALNNNGFIILFLIVGLLLLLNQFLEIVKWRLLIFKLERISFWNATKAILTGISVSMFMPNRIGDYFGRVFVLKSANRMQAVLVTILGSLAQFLSTIIFGLIASLFFYPFYFGLNDRLNVWMYIGLILIILAMIFIMIFAFLNFASFSDLIKRISGHGYRRIKKYTKVFSWYNSNDLMKVLGLSLFRYLVFSLQFYLLLRAFDLKIPYFEAMMLIALVYLFMTIIPTIALTELGVRGSVSLFVFSLYFEPLGSWNDQAALAVASASTILWLINLALPALLGIIFVYSLRFFRKVNGNGSV